MTESVKKLYSSAMIPIEQTLYTMGLANSPTSWLVRMAVGALGTGILLFIAEPSWAFVNKTVDDKAYTFPKDWTVTANPRALEANPELFTRVPWWLAAVIVGVAFGTLV